MGRTQTEIPGFAENVRQGLRRVRDEMRRAGHSPDEIDAILKAQVEKTLELNARRGELKRELLSVTARLRAEFRNTDWMASGYLDAAMGAVGVPAVQPVRHRRHGLPLRGEKEARGINAGGPLRGGVAGTRIQQAVERPQESVNLRQPATLGESSRVHPSSNGRMGTGTSKCRSNASRPRSHTDARSPPRGAGPRRRRAPPGTGTGRAASRSTRR